MSSPDSKKREMENGGAVRDETESTEGTTTTNTSAAINSWSQILGHTAMEKLAQANILICGLGGLGFEIAKNLIFMGVKSVMLHDTSTLKESARSSSFLIEADISSETNRAEDSRHKLSELNNCVIVESSTEKLTKEFLQKFQIVLLTKSPLHEQLRVAEIVRSLGNALIIAQTRGLFAQVFCDFGTDFTVVDKDGEKPLAAMIAAIAKDKETYVTCVDEHKLNTGDCVTFSEVKGMTQLNDDIPHEIKVLGPYTFSIGDTTAFSDYQSGGVVTQIKMPPDDVEFKPLAQALEQPDFIKTDESKSERPAQLHLAFRALNVFETENGRQPIPWSRTDSKAFLKIAQEINSKMTGAAKVEVVDEQLLSTFSHVCQGVLNPVDATIGGVVAQEAIKACTGMFMPIVQWLYFDAMECLPENCNHLTEEDCRPTGSRYDGQIAVFGADFQKKLGSLQYFVIGAGAIGREIMKNLALMGVGAGEGGHIYVTDMDHVSKLKSSTAAAAAKKMNPNVNVTAYEEGIGPQTETFFDSNFYGKLDGVVNAVDSVEARRYMERRCVYHRKPLLMSGTYGTKGNVQVVVPHLTESNSTLQELHPEIPISLSTLGLAGSIIPSIQTTSSVVAGLVSIELLKLAQGHKQLKSFKNSSVNLTLPIFGFSNPIEAPKKKYYEREWTLWDRFDVVGELTLRQFLQYFENKYKLEITKISYGVYLLYAASWPLATRTECYYLPVSKVVESVTNTVLEPHIRAIVFELTCNSLDGVEVEVPKVLYHISATQKVELPFTAAGSGSQVPVQFSFTSKFKPPVVSSPMGGGVPSVAKKVLQPASKWRFGITNVIIGTDSPLGSIYGTEAANVSENQPLPSPSAIVPSLIPIVQPVWTFTQNLHGEAEGGTPNRFDNGPEAKEPVVRRNYFDNLVSKKEFYPSSSQAFEEAPAFPIPDSLASNEGTEAVNMQDGDASSTSSEASLENGESEANPAKRPKHDDDDDDDENNHVEEGQTNRVRIGGMVVYRLVKKDGEQKGKPIKVGKGILELNDEMKSKERTNSTISVRTGADIFLNSYIVPGMILKKRSAESILLSAQDVDGNMQLFVLKATSEDSVEEMETLFALLQGRSGE